MNVISIIMAIFSVFGALDLLFGNRLGVGKEFERGLKTFGTLALSMIGMIVLSPLIAKALYTPLQSLNAVMPIEPSSIVSSLFANDMGGATLAMQFTSDEKLGYFNGLVVGSMMGATVSFTLPYALGATEKEQRKPLMLGLLCGICTIPLGCFTAGLIAGIPVVALLLDLIPLVLLGGVMAFGIFKFPNASVKIFGAFGAFIKALVLVGLTIGIFEYLTGWDIVPYTAPIQEGVDIVFNIAAVLTGAFPLMYLLSKALQKPLRFLGRKMGINEASALGLFSTLATSVTTFEMMKDMDERGVTLNAAFCVSAAFTFADHMAFTLSFNADYLLSVIVGKLVAGVFALALALLICTRKQKRETVPTENKKIA